MDTNNLSKSAKEEYDKLTQRLQRVVAEDKVREPKLTDEEKTELAAQEACIKKYIPVIQKFEDLINTKTERLNLLERNGQTMVLEGADVDALVAETILLKPALEYLEGAIRMASLESNNAKSRIDKIKESARKRELLEEGIK